MMKKIMSGIVSLVMVFGILGGLPVSVSAAELTATHTIPATMKVGQRMLYKSWATIHNLLPNEEFMGGTLKYDKDLFWEVEDIYPPRGGPSDGKADASGNYGDVKNYGCIDYIPYKSGTVKVKASIIRTLNKDKTKSYVLGSGDYDYDEQCYVDTSGEKYYTKIYYVELTTIKVEQPVITNNAPSAVKVGSSLNLTTAITNTAYSNSKTSNHKDNEPFYTPSVEILEGKDIVKQSKQDYTNTLNTSETLTFSKTGTIKLKVTYRPTVYQTVSYNEFDYDSYIKTCKNIGIEAEKQGENAILCRLDGSIEKTITIKVTDGGTTTNPPSTNTSKAPTKSSTSNSSAPETTSSVAPPVSSADELPVNLTDKDTGIEIGAQDGVIPEGTTLVVSKSNVVLQDADGKFAAFDISLESDGVKIQPNGKVLVSIPIPSGYDKERLAIYYIAEDGTKTELPSTVDGDKITFETDHFSTYAVAEKAVADTLTDKQTPKGNSPVLWIILSVVVVVVLAGAGIAVWYFKFRKNTENE